MSDPVEVTFSWTFRANCPRTWRQRVATRLHDWIARIDGRNVIAIEVRTSPQLSANTVAECMNDGLRHSCRVLAEACRTEALERALRIERPDLYEQEQQ